MDGGCCFGTALKDRRGMCEPYCRRNYMQLLEPPTTMMSNSVSNSDQLRRVLYCAIYSVALREKTLW